MGPSLSPDPASHPPTLACRRRARGRRGAVSWAGAAGGSGSLACERPASRRRARRSHAARLRVANPSVLRARTAQALLPAQGDPRGRPALRHPNHLLRHRECAAAAAARQKSCTCWLACALGSPAALPAWKACTWVCLPGRPASALRCPQVNAPPPHPVTKMLMRTNFACERAAVAGERGCPAPVPEAPGLAGLHASHGRLPLTTPPALPLPCPPLAPPHGLQPTWTSARARSWCALRLFGRCCSLIKRLDCVDQMWTERRLPTLPPSFPAGPCLLPAPPSHRQADWDAELVGLLPGIQRQRGCWWWKRKQALCCPASPLVTRPPLPPAPVPTPGRCDITLVAPPFSPPTVPQASDGHVISTASSCV